MTIARHTGGYFKWFTLISSPETFFLSPQSMRWNQSWHHRGWGHCAFSRILKMRICKDQLHYAWQKLVNGVSMIHLNEKMLVLVCYIFNSSMAPGMGINVVGFGTCIHGGMAVWRFDVGSSSDPVRSILDLSMVFPSENYLVNQRCAKFYVNCKTGSSPLHSSIM